MSPIPAPRAARHSLMLEKALSERTAAAALLSDGALSPSETLEVESRLRDLDAHIEDLEASLAPDEPEASPAGG